MSLLPNSLKKIALFLERLPGIGEKTANRLAFYFLKLPSEDLQEFAQSILDLKTKTKLCKNCLNLTEEELCYICKDTKRDQGVIIVVEDVLDLLSFETGNIYQGIYHVLHGKIDPLNHMGPDDIHLKELLSRITNHKSQITEIILATNPDMEGEATAMYIRNKIKDLPAGKQGQNSNIKVTRLGYGLPIGANLEYADYMTLKKSMENRNNF